MSSLEPSEIGGGALLIGFLLVGAVLFRAPGGLDAATVDARSVVYFLVLPAGGLLAGGYAYRGGAYSSIPTVVFGSYLGVFGLSLTLGALLAVDPVGLPLGVGVAVLSLAVVALVSVPQQVAARLHLGSVTDV